MQLMTASWQFWAVLSAVFAALTAVFAKVGVDQVDADFATSSARSSSCSRSAACVLVALFGAIFLGERLTGPNGLGVLFVALGVVLLAWKGVP